MHKCAVPVVALFLSTGNSAHDLQLQQCSNAQMPWKFYKHVQAHGSMYVYKASVRLYSERLKHPKVISPTQSIGRVHMGIFRRVPTWTLMVALHHLLIRIWTLKQTRHGNRYTEITKQARGYSISHPKFCGSASASPKAARSKPAGDRTSLCNAFSRVPPKSTSARKPRHCLVEQSTIN